MRRKSKFGKHSGMVDSPIAEIVNAGQRFAAGERGVGVQGVMQIGGDQSRLPVVAMEDIGAEKVAGHLEGRARQQPKPDRIIRKVAILVAVEAGAVIKRRIVQKVIGNGSIFGAIDAGVEYPGADPDI